MNFLPLGLFAAGLLFCLVFTAFGCTIVVSLASVAIACNQTLSSIMVQELRQSLYDDKEEMALALEDTTIVLAALVPWSVAAAVPLSVPHPGALPLPSTFTCSHSGAGCAHLFANVNRGLSND